jgi:hypothetical protein
MQLSILSQLLLRQSKIQAKGRTLKFLRSILMRRIKTHHWDPTIGQEATNRQDNEAAEPAGDTKDVVIKAADADAVVAAAEVGEDAASHGHNLLP